MGLTNQARTLCACIYMCMREREKERERERARARASEIARERPKHSLIPTCPPSLSSAMHPAHAYPPPFATVSPRPSTPPPLAAPQTRPSWPATAAAPRQTGATPAAWQNFSNVSATAYQPRTSTIGRDFREFLPAFSAATPLARMSLYHHAHMPAAY